MSGLPEPLTPPDCDLRGMPYMPVDIVRLFDSNLYALSTGDEFKAAFTLWGKAFLQVPAGSLPDDDRILAHLSSAGARWGKVKAMALHGWNRHSDGRLYHPVVAQQARQAWEARLAQRARTEAARAAKLAKKGAAASDSGPTEARRQSVTSSVTDTATTSVTEAVTGSKGREGKGREDIKSSEAIASAATDAAAPAEAPAPDARTALWREGLPRLQRLTGKPPAAARAMLGRYLRDAHDDCAMVASVLFEAEQARPVEPQAWIAGAIRKRTSSPQPTAAPRGPSNHDKTAWMRPLFFGEGARPATPFDLDGYAEETLQ